MTNQVEYTLPRIWSWSQENGGAWRLLSGATHDKALPSHHPLQLYSLGTPNGVKVTVMLEELLALGHADAEYDAWLIRIGDGDQFGSGFVSVNPNSKIPALLDRDGPKPVRVFESGAILMYLAEKFRAFVPTETTVRAESLSWLFWQMGSAPYLGGGLGHFYAYAPTKIDYAIDRSAMEVKRQLDVPDKRLADNEYLGGCDYTIADTSVTTPAILRRRHRTSLRPQNRRASRDTSASAAWRVSSPLMPIRQLAVQCCTTCSMRTEPVGLEDGEAYEKLATKLEKRKRDRFHWRGKRQRAAQSSSSPPRANLRSSAAFTARRSECYQHLAVPPTGYFAWLIRAPHKITTNPTMPVRSPLVKHPTYIGWLDRQQTAILPTAMYTATTANHVA